MNPLNAHHTTPNYVQARMALTHFEVLDAHCLNALASQVHLPAGTKLALLEKGAQPAGNSYLFESELTLSMPSSAETLGADALAATLARSAYAITQFYPCEAEVDMGAYLEVARPENPLPAFYTLGQAMQLGSFA